MRHAPRPVLGSVLQSALPFAVALVVGVGITLGIRAALQDPHAGHAGHDTFADMDSDAHAGHDADAHAGHADHGSMPGMAAAGGLLVDLGNTECPIMGGEVNGETYTEWRGLRVGHCCPPCAEDFRESPETYLDDMGVEWRPLVEKIEAVTDAEGEERERLLAELRTEHTIVREPEAR